MTSRRQRSLSLPAVIAASGRQRVHPEVDPEDGRRPAEERRKTLNGKSRRPSLLDALVPKASIPVAPGLKSPAHAWEALCQKSKQLPKPDLDANPPLTIEDIRRAALTEWVAEISHQEGEMTQFQIEIFSHVMATLKVCGADVHRSEVCAVTIVCFAGV